MKLFRKVVDERQELEMMRIDRSAFYVTFGVLSIVCTVQIFAMDFDFTHVSGEFFALVIGGVWLLIGYIRSGLWGNFTEPGMKSYLLFSAAGAFVFSIPIPLRLYFRYKSGLADCILAFGLQFIIIFVAGFLVMAFTGSIIKKRREKLQMKFTDDE